MGKENHKGFSIRYLTGMLVCLEEREDRSSQSVFLDRKESATFKKDIYINSLML